jgi:hypothetical protein
MRDGTYFRIQAFKRNELGELEWAFIAGDMPGVPLQLTDRDEAIVRWRRALGDYRDVRIVRIELRAGEVVDERVVDLDEPQFKLID